MAYHTLYDMKKAISEHNIKGVWRKSRPQLETHVTDLHLNVPEKKGSPPKKVVKKVVKKGPVKKSAPVFTADAPRRSSRIANKKK